MYIDSFVQLSIKQMPIYYIMVKKNEDVNSKRKKPLFETFILNTNFKYYKPAIINVGQNTNYN